MLKNQAKVEEITVSELCRRKLKATPQLIRIEFLLEKIARKLEVSV
jgi:hypothetical protein